MLRLTIATLILVGLLGGCPQPTTSESGSGGGDSMTSGDASGGNSDAGGDATSGDSSGAGGDSSGDSADSSGDNTSDSSGDMSSGDSDGGGSGDAVDSSSSGMTASELQLAMDALDEMNMHRAAQGLGPLTWYQEGAEVAYAHSAAMENDGFFDHVDPGTGKDPATRALEAGITHNPDGFISPSSGNPFVGENLYMASGFTPTGALPINSWITSPGHHTQMVAPLPVSGASTMPAWTHCGIGVKVDGSTSRWTAMFFKEPN